MFLALAPVLARPTITIMLVVNERCQRDIVWHCIGEDGLAVLLTQHDRQLRTVE